MENSKWEATSFGDLCYWCCCSLCLSVSHLSPASTLIRLPEGQSDGTTRQASIICYPSLATVSHCQWLYEEGLRSFVSPGLALEALPNGRVLFSVHQVLGPIYSTKKTKSRSWRDGLVVRTVATLSEDLGLVPSTRMESNNYPSL